MSLSSHHFQISYGPNDDRLHGFYIPALERSVRYDRSAGYFSSSALAIAAAGVVRLIANEGRMRLLVGAQLSEEDCEAIRRGESLKGTVEAAMAGKLDTPDDLIRKRLEVLAWMVAQGTLEMRVVLPRGRDGAPLPASEAEEYYHPKEGVFADAEGQKVGFSGSSNESVRGWKKNYERFAVHTSWERQVGEDLISPGTPFIRDIERHFDELWNDESDSWIALDVPEAVRRQLLDFCPPDQPREDPLERRPKPKEPKPDEEAVVSTAAERIAFRFLREAPHLPNAARIGIETSTINPLPHQLRVVRETVERYPENFLFCDEVGLGKTIEAGLALRQLVISGKVERALLLVPKSVLRQWQEELYEKFVLNVPRYEDGEIRDVFDREVQHASANPWRACPILLASSQLAKRRERQEEVLDAGPWDLVIVDESHHARRKDFLSGQYRPNRLLELLTGTDNRPGIKDRTRCLYLLTATPMQVHPVEVWDLLRVLGVGGRWGALEDNFFAFFEELRKPFEDRDWEFLLGMVADYLDAGGRWDDRFETVVSTKLGLVEWETIKGLLRSSKRGTAIQQLSADGRAALHEMVKRHTPIRTLVWRNTRALLRRYRERGLLKANVPHRDPRPEWIALTEAERELYDRIDEYISQHYRKYEAERKGLGFVMTVYRRRLTSSFFAIRKSLERRRDFLLGLAKDAGLTDDDVEQADLDFDFGEAEVEGDPAQFMAEVVYIEDFIRELERLGSDSKMEQLVRDLRFIFNQRDTVIVFTQYTDTMDYVRDELREVYGSQIACYSGRGGEVWDGAAWMPRHKETIKEEFRQGEKIKVLLCTESASEGLNLQTCGVLINYDMPWNPMRVEQRIGRIDRIGQTFETVWIRNYFYADTVEAVIYQRLDDRIGWFVDVVGELQPILHKIGWTIEEVAMLPAEKRAKRLEEQIAALREEVERHEGTALDLDAHVEEDPDIEDMPEPPVSLQQLEQTLVRSRALGHLFRPHPEINGAHLLAWKGRDIAVTFVPEVFDRHPNSVQLLSYGEGLLDKLLVSVGEPPHAPEPAGIAELASPAPARVTVFAAPRGAGAEPIRNLPGLQEAVGTAPGDWTPTQVEAADRLGVEAAAAVAAQLQEVEDNRSAAERLALVEAARQILVRCALIELARAQTPDLFEERLPYGFGREAVSALARHGVPFRGLLSLVGPEVPEAHATDTYFGEVQGLGTPHLKRRWEAQRREGVEVLKRYRKALAAPPASEWAQSVLRRWWYTVRS